MMFAEPDLRAVSLFPDAGAGPEGEPLHATVARLEVVQRQGRDGLIAAVQGNRTAISIPRSAARRGAVQTGIPSNVTRPRVT